MYLAYHISGVSKPIFLENFRILLNNYDWVRTKCSQKQSRTEAAPLKYDGIIEQEVH